LPETPEIGAVNSSAADHLEVATHLEDFWIATMDG
jgi:hypothetical protein